MIKFTLTYRRLTFQILQHLQSPDLALSKNHSLRSLKNALYGQRFGEVQSKILRNIVEYLLKRYVKGSLFLWRTELCPKILIWCYFLNGPLWHKMRHDKTGTESLRHDEDRTFLCNGWKIPLLTNILRKLLNEVIRIVENLII